MWAMVCSFGLADPVDALVGLLGGFAQFAVGGFLCGVIIPLPMYPLSAIHPEGSSPSNSPDGAWCGHVVHGAGVGVPGPHEPAVGQDQDQRRSCRSSCDHRDHGSR